MTIKQALIKGVTVLKLEKISTPKLKARLLLQYVLKKPRQYLIVYDNQKLTEKEEQDYLKYIELLKKSTNNLDKIDMVNEKINNNLQMITRYDENNNKVELILKYDDINEVIIENEKATGTIDIIKKSLDYNPYTNVKKDSPLKGCEFEIYNDDGRMIYSAKTDSNGKVQIPIIYFENGGKYYYKIKRGE